MKEVQGFYQIPFYLKNIDLGGRAMQRKNREIVNPRKVFSAEGFTHAVIAEGNKTVYLSGQLPWDENFQVVGKGDLVKQTRKVFENIQHILDDIGVTWDNVVKTTIYTTNPYEGEAISKTKHEFLNGVASPAETLIGVDSLASPDCMIEIEAIAVM